MTKFTSEQMDRAVTVAELLKEFEPGFLPYPIFQEVVRLNATAAIELVPILDSGLIRAKQVMLVRRPVDDPIWPNMLHLPGTVIRATDESITEGLSRVTSEEIFLDHLPFCNFAFVHMRKSARGSEVALVYIVNLDHIPTGFEAYDLNNLPDDVIEHHVALLNILREESRWL